MKNVINNVLMKYLSLELARKATSEILCAIDKKNEVNKQHEKYDDGDDIVIDGNMYKISYERPGECYGPVCSSCPFNTGTCFELPFGIVPPDLWVPKKKK